jgi:hypothetical protein
MKRIIMTFGASAALALAFFAGPAAAQAAPTHSATSVRSAPAGAVSPAAAAFSCSNYSYLLGNSGRMIDHGQGNLVTMSPFGIEFSTYVAVSDGTQDGHTYYEIEDCANGGGQCLDIVGLSGGGYGVNTENCNDRSAELWWLPSGLTPMTGDGWQIINQYGTKLLDHDACLWDSTTGIAPTVQDCVASQPSQQLWLYGF